MLEKELTTSEFQSLVTLEIGDWHLTEDLYVMLRFLQLSPRLEKLKLVLNSVRRMLHVARIIALVSECSLNDTLLLFVSRTENHQQMFVQPME